jgi:metal-responsive CopG/Arc/MetJ family transcriptional regulator
MYHVSEEVNPMMKRINITLSEVYLKKLKTMSKKTGIAVSDLIRRAIDEYWEKFKKKSAE